MRLPQEANRSKGLEFEGDTEEGNKIQCLIPCLHVRWKQGDGGGEICNFAKSQAKKALQARILTCAHAVILTHGPQLCTHMQQEGPHLHTCTSPYKLSGCSYIADLEQTLMVSSLFIPEPALHSTTSHEHTHHRCFSNNLTEISYMYLTLLHSCFVAAETASNCHMTSASLLLFLFPDC